MAGPDVKFCLGLFVIFPLFLLQGLFAQDLDQGSLWGTPESGAHQIEGVARCYACHSKTDLAADLPKNIVLPPDVTGINDDGWVLLNEMLTWAGEDKHYQAYTVLLGERSQRMAQLLGVVDPEGKSLVHQDARCLACHSAVPIARLPRDGHLVRQDTLNNSQFNLGVSCEGCHGPSGVGGESGKAWINAHVDSNVWRTMDSLRKFQDFGYWDVRSFATQAEICLSCHLGDVDQGKVITHEMYAAGHPPLPSFELATFVAQQPQHWRDFEEKAPGIKADFQAKTSVPEIDDGFSTTRMSLVSSLMTVSQFMELTADLIDEEVTCDVEKPSWPELANYACFACHHDLQRDGWRQRRPASRPPGRPVLHEWTMVLASVAARHLQVGSDFDRLSGQVEEAVTAQVFGNRIQLLSASREFSDAARQWAHQLDHRRLMPGEVDAILKDIARIGAERTLDYDSARQLIWAFERVFHDSTTHSDPEDASATMTVADARTQRIPRPWTGWLPGESLSRPEEVLKRLEAGLILDLRQGRAGTQTIPSDGNQERPLTEVELEKTLPKISGYDPEIVQQHFHELLGILAE
ncbi:MAG: hypothetical protein KDA80_22115 [Planctomycetaceae bacterium]|nr:hypothetical protein [Planctomycetaceae bacterium]